MIEELKAVRGLIERGWCRGAYARDEDGESVDIGDPLACSWCLDGALRTVTASEDIKDLVQRFTGGIWAFNDYAAKGKEDVLALLDRAIAYATLEAVEAQLRRGWCVGALAQDAEGKGTGVRSSNAVSWCLVGAFSLIGGDYLAMDTLRSIVGPYLSEFNNQCESVEPVLAAISMAKSSLLSQDPCALVPGN